MIEQDEASFLLLHLHFHSLPRPRRVFCLSIRHRARRHHARRLAGQSLFTCLSLLLPPPHFLAEYDYNGTAGNYELTASGSCSLSPPCPIMAAVKSQSPRRAC